jgi:hypothetical protein
VGAKKNFWFSEEGVGGQFFFFQKRVPRTRERDRNMRSRFSSTVGQRPATSFCSDDHFTRNKFFC